MSQRCAVVLGILTSSWLLAGCLRFGSHPEHWACETSSDCPSGQTCGDDSKCQVPECTNEKPCPGSQACFAGNCLGMSANPSSEACFPDGRNASECQGFACSAGHCLTFCTVDGQCQSGYQCAGQTCEPLPKTIPDGSSCRAATECDSGTCCAPRGLNGICLSDCSSHGPGVSCVFDQQCLEGACANGFCTSGISVNPCEQVQCGIINGAVCGTCPSGWLCDGGQCRAPVCDPSKPYYCDQNMLNRCESAFVSTPQGSCGLGELCVDGRTSCEPYTCAADRGFCIDEVYRHCTAVNHYDGAAPSDCSASGRKCSSLGCGLVTVEEVPLLSPTMQITALACGNVILVEKNTSLLSLLQFVGGGLDLRWFAYSSNEPTQGYERNLMVADPSAGNGTRQSPELGLRLEMGRYYFMGASTAGASYEVVEALANPAQLSFGQVIGGYCAPGGLLDPLPTLEPHGIIPQTISTMDL